ncbi:MULTISPECIES: hypothetical protein [unclassified Leifsonia]|uniref:hypothetical protein n=1 Tax=unclassified Leifsonia TaxID=2663824 RepID=UPI0006FD0F6E|nr:MULTISPECIES: hypothetical protein [unclassified Leifsonia]KQX06549.1 hypothetical protein ASC59_01415 [Leifsonia sp. Root1293]KRA10833.1 hypothetical protein ASD61_01415 [Leifsonia sp. Root60]
MKTLIAGVVAVLLSAALSGCTTSTSEPMQPVVSNAPAPRPTPAVVTPAVAVPTAPAAAFGGDCSVVATEAEISDATGGPSVLLLPSPADAGYADWAIRGLGGIRCTWSNERSDGVWVTVVPVATAGQDIIDDVSLGQPYCYGACSFSTTVGDWWYAGVVSTPDDSGIDPMVAIDDLVAAFGARAAANDAVAPTRIDGTWDDVPECEILGERVDTTALLGSDLEPTPGNVPGEAGPGFYGSLRAADYSACFWEGDGTMAEIGLLPGAWWAVDEQAALPGAVAVDVPGAVRAVLVPGADDFETDTLYVTDGVNLATASGGYGTDQLGALAVAVMAGVAD